MPRFTSKEFFTTHDPGDNPVGVVASGGTTIVDAIFKVHVFTSSGTFTIDRQTSIEYLVVAGGGGGSDGGGGAGGLLTNTLTLNSGTYTVTIGAGGSSGSNGANSSIGALVVTTGGGFGGAGAGSNGTNGGSGGGAGRGAFNNGPGTTGGLGVAGPPSQGYNGGDGYWQNLTWSGGGGGAGGNAVSTATVAGTTYTQNWGGACIGGPGYFFSSGSFSRYGDPIYPGYYASGGTGYNDNGFGEVMMPRMPGGGGSKAVPNAASNTGGGAGSSGTGGSGVVIIKYRR